MYSKFLKICSFVLTIALLINLLPVQVWGTELETVVPASSDVNESLADTNEITPLSESTIVGEIIEGRTEYSKEYLMNNGLNLVVLYPEAVHYEKNNKWEEIDNTLKAVGFGSDVRYTNTAGEWTVSFPQQLSRNKQVTISRDGYTLSFGLAGELSVQKNLETSIMSATQAELSTDKKLQLNVDFGNPVLGEIEELNLTTLRESMEYPETFVDTVFSRMKYNNVYGDTDIIYDLNPKSVKESIVIEAYDPALYGYQYTLNTGTMIPILENDGSITLYSPDRTEIVMSMPAPYMVDNSGEMSYDINVSLEANGSCHLLTYHLPVDWLADEDRTWPVILDPVVEAGTSTGNILDHFVAEYYSADSTNGALMCGYNPDFGKMRTFIKFSNIPTLAAADLIVNATLSLTYLGGSTGTTTIGAHKVNANWETGTITWANQPAHNAVIEDYVGLSGSGRYSWEVTDIARGWYETGNTGIMLKALESIENGTAENWKKFYSVDYSVYNTERWPSLTIMYRNTSGIESYWDYTTVSAGRAGTGYINNLTGNLTWVHEDLGFDGNRMPVAISHIYNVDESATNNFGIGYGWRTNYHQTVQLSESGEYYIWTDGDGTKHELVPGTATNTYVDQEGLCLKLTVATSSYTITDKYGNSSQFDSSGRLVKLINNQATTSQITISYVDSTSKRISTITDGVGRIYKFTYNSNNLLTKIGYHGTNGTSGSEITNVQFAYSNSNLITITYKDSLDSHFAYSGHYLTSATDVDGCKITFTYSSGTTKRITKTQEYSGTTSGHWMTFEYARNKVKIADTKHTQIRYFNDFGNLISSQDDEGNAEFSQYAANRHTDNSTDVNKLTLSSKQQNTVVNLLEHSSFEAGNTWSMTASASCIRTTSDSYMGSYSLLIASDSSGICAYSTAITIPSQETLTFSAYVQSSGTSIQLGLGAVASVENASEIQQSGSEWNRIEVSYTNNSSSSVSVRPLLILGGAGSVYIDCVQAELSGSANRYNLIQNGDFRTTSFWSSSTGRTTTTSACPQLNSTAYKITGDPNLSKSVNQTVAASGRAGDVFVLSGWGKGNSVPLTDSARQFGLRIRFNHSDGSTNSCVVRFDATSCSSTDWQYAAGRAVATEDYSSVLVELICNKNANDVYFDGIQLYKEEFGERYTYDSNRNVSVVTDMLGQTTTYTYNNNNDLTKIVEPSGLTTTNTYSYHNLKTSEQFHASIGTFAKSTYTYDTYGNQTNAKSEYNGLARETKTTYTSNGNYVATTTDDLGNVTTYSYDPQTGMLLSVKNPKDTNSTKTNYTYDEMYRLENTTATTDQSKTMSATYTYSNDLLSTIVTGSSIYNFTYGAFDQRATVAVGNTSLATYAYTTDVYRRLKTIDYGNQDDVNYTYDDLGRVIKEEYCENGSTTVYRTITYRYNTAGDVTYRKDSKTNIATTYFYDTYGRNIGMYENVDDPEASGLTAHRLRYVYDDLGRMATSSETYDGLIYTTAFSYDESGRVETISAGKAKQEYEYDKFNRLVSSQIHHNNSSNWMYEKYVTYKSGTVGTSNKISTLSYEYSAGNAVIYTYNYDANGNITSEKVGSYTTTYVYDSANQLIRENNQKAGKTWVWTYDGAGNILSKKQYAYTTGTLGSVQSTITYTYGNANWGDLLTKYNGVTISYDAIGNPLSDGTWYYTWEQGRQLQSMESISSGAAWIFTYNADGMRTKRTNGSTTYNYTYHGSQLTHMERGSVELHFSYDASGSPMAVVYNNNTYYYLLNQQGDVAGILDSSGTQVVAYTYDAWGRPLSTTGTMASSLGQYNPLRYRGYVYDQETGLYYVSNRYYDPEIGRWINADDTAYLGADGTPLSYNLFAYCGNNPVMGYDPTGHWDWGWEEQAALGTTVLIVGLALLLAAPTGGSSLAFGALALSSSTAVAAGTTMAVAGMVVTGDALHQATVNYAKKSKKSDKEKSTDKPSWVTRDDVNLNKSAQQNAKELMDNKYGTTWPKGTREYSQIVKWINRCLRDLVIAIAFDRLEG